MGRPQDKGGREVSSCRQTTTEDSPSHVDLNRARGGILRVGSRHDGNGPVCRGRWGPRKWRGRWEGRVGEQGRRCGSARA